MSRNTRQARAFVDGATLLCTLASACARESPHSETRASRPAPASAISADSGRARSGCDQARVETGDFHLQTTDGNGVSRDYQVLVPASYDAQTPLAVTFVYHGANSNDDDARRYGLQGAAGAAAASIFVFPRGIPYQKYGVGWNDHCDGYDMLFFDHMLETLSSTYCVDDRRVFAAGFSWGGDHVTSLACCRGSKLRAIAAASCTDEFRDPADYRTYDNGSCPSSGTTAIRFTFDPAGDSSLSAQQFTATSALYRSMNACSASSIPAGTPCASYQGCTQPFVACGYAGLGHRLPPTWAEGSWQFFTSVSRDPALKPR